MALGFVNLNLIDLTDPKVSFWDEGLVEWLFGLLFWPITILLWYSGPLK